MKSSILIIGILALLVSCAPVVLKQSEFKLWAYFMTKNEQNKTILTKSPVAVSFGIKNGETHELYFISLEKKSSITLQLESAEKLNALLKEYQEGSIQFSDIRTKVESNIKTTVVQSPFKDEKGESCFSLISALDGMMFFCKPQVPELISILNEFTKKK